MIIRPPSLRDRMVLPEDPFMSGRHRSAAGRRPLEFLLNPYRFGGSTPTAFDPLKKGPAITLSGANLVAAKASGTAYNSVLTDTSKTTGKHYFEIVITQSSISANYIVIGVAPSTASLTNFIGFDSASYGYYQNTGQKVNNNVLASYGSVFAQGHTVCVALDLTAGKIWFAINNTWAASGDPAAGTNPAYTGVSGTLFGGVSLYNGGSVPVDMVTAKFASGSTTYSPPSGFTHWG